MNIGFALSVFISILPFPILAFLYKLIPTQVPLFVDLLGNPTVFATKSILTVFRLPIMGLMIQVLCIAMYFIKFNDQVKMKINRNMWIVVSFIGALKMSLTSLEVLIYENMYLLNILRTFVLIIIIAGVIILLFNLFTLYKRQKHEFLKEYYKAMNRWTSITVIIALAVYMLVVFLPIIMEL